MEKAQSKSQARQCFERSTNGLLWSLTLNRMGLKCRMRSLGATIGVSFGFDSRSDNGSSAGFGKNDLRIGTVLFDILSSAMECSASS